MTKTIDPREAALWTAGPLQREACAEHDAHLAALAEEGEGAICFADIDPHASLVRIPDALRDGTFWAFRFIARDVKPEVDGPFYDYRYRAYYCPRCNHQYRYAHVSLVRFIAGERWQRLDTCPYGHLRDATVADEAIRHLLSGPRLIEERQ